MSLIIMLALVAGQPAPGRVWMKTTVTPTGTQTEQVESPLDDTTVNLSGRWGVAVNLGNLDDDPWPEVVCRLSWPAPNDLNITKIVVLDHDLSLVWQDTWGYSGNPEMPSVTLADIDNDGRDDLLVPMAETFFPDPPAYKCRIYALDGMTGRVKPGWPFILPGWPENPYHDSHSEVVAADINGDGVIEVVVQVEDLGSIRKPGAGLYVLRPNGDSLWKYLFYTDTLDRHGAYTSPAVCDLDGDGQMEIICHSGWFQREYPYPLIERRLWIFNSNGTVRRHWQTEGPGAGYTPDYSSPAVADLDGDGEYEIVVARRPGFLDVYDSAGNMRRGFPVNLTTDARYHLPSAGVTRAFASPAFADLNHDGNLEIVIGSSGRESTNTRWAGRVHALQHDGTSLHGFPVVTRNAIWYSPGIGNFDSDPTLEIMTAGCDSNFYCVNHDGTSSPGWPRTGFSTYWIPDAGSYAFIEGVIPLSKTPFFADIDRDSLVEVLMEGKNGLLYVFDGAARFQPNLMLCPTFRFNKERTGWFRAPVSSISAGPCVEMRQSVWSYPDGSIVRAGRAAIQLRQGTSGPVQVFDRAGRVVAVLARQPLPEGEHRLEFSAPGAGVYLVRAAGLEQPGRLVVVE